MSNKDQSSETLEAPPSVTQGVIVNEIGMRPMITQFQQEYIWPIAPWIP